MLLLLSKFWPMRTKEGLVAQHCPARAKRCQCAPPLPAAPRTVANRGGERAKCPVGESACWRGLQGFVRRVPIIRLATEGRLLGWPCDAPQGRLLGGLAAFAAERPPSRCPHEPKGLRRVARAHPAAAGRRGPRLERARRRAARVAPRCRPQPQAHGRTSRASASSSSPSERRSGRSRAPPVQQRGRRRWLALGRDSGGG